MKECDIASRRVDEEYASQLAGTEEMIKEKMDYIKGEFMLFKKECEQRCNHEKEMKLLEDQKHATDAERQRMEQQRLECQRNNDRLNDEIQKLTLAIANRQPQVIHVHSRGGGGCVIQ